MCRVRIGQVHVIATTYSQTVLIAPRYIEVQMCINPRLRKIFLFVGYKSSVLTLCDFGKFSPG